MGFMDELRFKVWNDVGAVVGLIEKWRPGDCKKEKDYERSLYAYLHETLGGVQVTKQFAQGRVRADLMIGDRVIVELKHDLDTTAKYQRLKGQIDDYVKLDKSVVVLLTGETDRNLRKELGRFIEEKGWDEDLLAGAKVTVFQK